MPDLLSDLNPVQKQAVQTTEGPTLILAGAGSGKTKALTHRVAYLIQEKGIPPENILCITFTNKAAGEMKERILKLLHREPRTTNSQPIMGTFHSICARILRKEGRHIGLPPNFSIYDEHDSLDAVKQAMAALDIATQKTSPTSVKNTISGAKNEMIPALEYPRVARGYFQEIVAKIYLKYQEILEKNKAVDFDDLLLLTVKLFQNNPDVLSKYQLQFRYILIDEYQDTNAVQYLLSKLLSNRYKNICVVGDASQCLPPGTEVVTPSGTKSIETIKTNDLVISAAGRGLTHAVKVCNVKTSNYKGKIFIIKTKSGRTLRATPNHITFARLSLKTNCYYVYLMFRKDKGYRIGIARSFRSAQRGRSEIGLLVRSNQENADKMWILRVCKDRSEANYWEQWFVVEYGIPSMVFSTGGRKMLITQEQINQLFDSINTRERVKAVFKDYCLFENYPHHHPKGVASRISPDRQLVHFTLFSDQRPSLRSPWCGHRVSINTSNEALEKQLQELGYFTRAGKRHTWRIETCHWSYENALSLAEKIASDGGGLTINHSAFIVDNKKFLFTPISHLRETMEIGLLEKDKVVIDEVVSVSTEDYQGEVYDLDIDTLHNYSANGIIVHNSIYAFRGADYKNIVNFKKDYPNARVFNLEQNYRSTQTILDAAFAVISKNHSHPILKLWTQNPAGEKIQVVETRSEADEALFIANTIDHLRGEAEQSTGSHLGGATFPTLNSFAVLYRTNAQSRALEEVFLKAGIPYVLVGGIRFYERKEIKDILAFLKLVSNPEDSISKARIEKVGKGRSAKFFAMLSEIQPNLINYTTLELLDKILEATDYLDYIDDGTEVGKGRVENVKELRSVAEQFPEIVQFLENVTLVESEYTSDEKLKKKQGHRDAVTLTTLHQAKGLEWPVVFMVGMEEGLFPHSRCLLDPGEMEEERRLCYVGITRAKNQLFLTYARQRLYFGTRSQNLTSRFLMDLPDAIVKSNTNYQDRDQFLNNEIGVEKDSDDWLDI
ncbi:hypothetical protein A3A14_01150 [Candidatus Daviesbacteria bacterium RIFCSPLOWO2_01_FULL_43_38]|uniref:DNA 3'-5' helicase n=1 Tax=Candidatus Daviesbacteria bacterium RIFCSPHIGHO2_12_FULL_43_11 TaxID=1797780 RepID=A0A1F5K2T2_9BACT|nr:MAG: hypothetical protein A2874_01175 [Candidatus Daviesbacteria bacterium RIFCSPHIGHO2_01_FULL_43_17]OGE35196.1 MAG: hypothetical protein A3E45_02845 [Candidatus Daviesbacteria bacterium RIFCSPHIGHO2_12_FULL_43_11]OGE63383.1 MAG: hypothetical protein A3A14_01150 [Candidatus Daviesbacteria bacterium RIFCSPLOWO2_01_FULL_43_38]OGE70842.1 MAG: hypothetical protein A3J21_00500 [Candidatus Daviesbacteria bacterium RIFCSPLOWO2_02_FULL_43_11]